MAYEIEIETEKSQKLKKKTQEVIMWFLLCSHSMILFSKLLKKEVGPNLGGGGVFSDLVGGSFRPIFSVSHFGLWLFWPKSESDNVCIIICV